MDDTIFRGKIERYHKRWLTNTLWVPGNGHLRIDLLSPTSFYEDASYSENFAIELKSKMVRYPKRMTTSIEDKDKEYMQGDSSLETHLVSKTLILGGEKKYSEKEY